MKRRLFLDDDDDDGHASVPVDVSPATFSTPRRKRARYGSLERTLAHMTLGNALTTAPEHVDAWTQISPPHPRELVPSSVEELVAIASEGDMEVEPTLVTTDTSATNLPQPQGMHGWESIASGQLEIKEVQISSAVLECLRRQPRHPPAPIPLSSQTSQALVLYRAPQPLSPSGQICEDQAEKLTATPLLVAHEDDVMEVE